uniref:HemA n=1 Tax=Salmonella typhimurium TaxID=90371 RepID=Q56122_SALTM|nr:HemA [Salmonella enterica subsp. enterica serovar Typhimurium]
MSAGVVPALIWLVCLHHTGCAWSIKERERPLLE